MNRRNKGEKNVWAETNAQHFVLHINEMRVNTNHKLYVSSIKITHIIVEETKKKQNENLF